LAQTAKARAGAARQRAYTVREQLEGRRKRNRGVDAAFSTWELDRNAGGSLLAAAIAYRLFLWLLPVSLILVAGLGFASSIGRNTASDVVRDIGIISIPAQSVNEAAHQSSRAWWLALGIGLVLLYAGTSGLIRALWAAHTLVWKSPATKIPNRPRLIGLFLAACLTMAVGTSVASIIRNASPSIGIIAMLADFLVYAAAWWFVSVQLPHGDASVVWLIPGATVLGGGVQLMHLLIVYYLSARLTSASKLYGTLGTAAALLLSLYLVGRLIIVAAEVNQALWTARSGWTSGVGPQRGDPAAGPVSSGSPISSPSPRAAPPAPKPDRGASAIGPESNPTVPPSGYQTPRS
jgi:uncharacterized BrkB/YihY/UPF0761 family membrane protein